MTLKLTERNILAAILIAGFVVRLAVALTLPNQGFDDADGYRVAGEQLWHTGHFASTYIMPLYPALVGLVGHPWGQWLLDVSLSTATIWLVYRLTVRLFDDRLAAVLAALAAAFYPYFIFYAAVGLTEPLFIALLLASMLAWYRGAFTLAAICAVLGVLTRPSLALLAPVFVVYFSLVIHKLAVGRTLRNVAVYAVTYVALMSPWWVHNYVSYGQFVQFDLASGFLLYAGNNPMNKSGGGIANVDWDPAHFNAITDPAARNRAFRDAGIAYIEHHPARTFELALVKFARFWRPWPYAAQYKGWFYQVVSLLSFGPVLLLSMVYLLFFSRGHWLRIAPILLFTAYLTAVHMVLVSSIRYRLPIEPLMIIFASVAVARVLERLRPVRQWRSSLPAEN